MILAIVGNPGAGKTTLAKALATRFGFTHISAGDVVRKLAETDEEVRDALADGELGPKDKTNKAMLDVLETGREANLVIDGFPRYLEQLDMLDESKIETWYLILACNEEDAVKRLSGRGRGDDTEDAIQRRMSVYFDETLPVVEEVLSRENSFFVSTDGEKSDVFNIVHHFLVYTAGFTPASTDKQ